MSGYGEGGGGPDDPGGLDDETARLLRVARSSSGEASASQKQALRAAVVAAVATAVATEAGAAIATTKLTAATATTTAATTAPLATATSVVVSKTLVGGLIGMLVGGVFVGAAVLVQDAPKAVSPPAASARPSAIATASITPLGPTAPPADLDRAPPPAPSLSASDHGARAPAPAAPPRGVDKDKYPDDIPSASASAATRAPGSLAEESAALRDVSRALAEGKPDEALRILEAGPKTGRLDEERKAARIVALCKAGRRSEAAPLRATFDAEHPQSNQRVRIAGACVDGAE